LYVRVPQIDDAENFDKVIEPRLDDTYLLTIWRQQFVDALTVLYFSVSVSLRLNVSIIDPIITTTTANW
jgi:hypothetical protein